MDIQLKQFVPSHVCLKCEGCCRFGSGDSPWRPKWDKKEFTDDQDYVTTIADCGKHLCRFFNKAEGTCQVYQDRPFECALYPFLLSKHGEQVHVFVHLACPYIQEHEIDPALEQYIQYLQEFFSGRGVRDFLQRNRAIIQDYTPMSVEIRHLFTLKGLQLQ